MYPQLPTRTTLSIVGALAVLLALVFPANPCPPRPQCGCRCTSRSGWRAMGCLVPRWCTRRFMQRAERRIRSAVDPQSGLPLLALERLTFRFVRVPALCCCLQPWWLVSCLARWCTGTRCAGTTRPFRCCRGSPLRCCWPGARPSAGAAAGRCGGLHRQRVLAAGLCGLALRHGSVAGSLAVKYVVLFLVFLVAAWRWRAARTPKVRETRTAHPAEKAPRTVVACAHCGVHIPVSDATVGSQGSYCSVAHRQLRES